MHGVMGKPPGAATDKHDLATSRLMLLMLVVMTGVAPISLYMLVPALPVLATIFDSDISIAQMLPRIRRQRALAESPPHPPRWRASASPRKRGEAVRVR